MGTLERAYAQVVSWWRGQGISARKELEAALDGFRVRFAYNSGTIENPALTYHDTRDVFEDGRVRSYTGDPRTLFEIQNLKLCHELTLDAFAQHSDLDEELLLEFHRTLTQGTYDERRWQAGERPGAYKLKDYVVGTGDMGATPEEARPEVMALLGEVRDAPREKALTVAAYFHAVLEKYHANGLVRKVEQEMGEQYLVLDIGGTFVKYALMTRDGQFVLQGKVASGTSSEEETMASLDLPRYAIGGGISARPETTQIVHEAVDALFDSVGPFLPFGKPEVVTCAFGNEANLIGALAFHLGR